MSEERRRGRSPTASSEAVGLGVKRAITNPPSPSVMCEAHGIELRSEEGRLRDPSAAAFHHWSL